MLRTLVAAFLQSSRLPRMFENAQNEKDYERGRRLHLDGHHEDALAIFAKLSKRMPRHVGLCVLTGRVYKELGQYDAARVNFNAAIKLRPKDARCHWEKGRLESLLGNFEQAHACFDEAIALDPSDARFVAAKGQLLVIEGRGQEALDLVRPLLEEGEYIPGLPGVLARLAPKFGLFEEAESALQEAIEDQDLSNTGVAGHCFQLGALLDKKGDYDRAFEAYERANTLKGVTVSEDEAPEVTDRAIAAWTPERLAELPRARLKTEVPVFILGMARSGTSLVEQILSSHPDAHGAGEREWITEISGALQRAGGGAGSVLTELGAIDQSAIDKAARDYLKRLRNEARSAKRITDKMPYNFRFLGLISLLFPKAKIIHCMRHPLDTSLSCYFINFATLNRYSYKLESIASFYRDYVRLMNHWKDVLDMDILDVRYEDMVADQEAMSRRIVDHIGLEWSDECLRFYESKRVTITASNEQVRQPIYRSSMRRHEKYEAHIAVLREALADIVAEYEATSAV